MQTNLVPQEIADSEKIINPITGAELTPEEIDTEVEARINALQFATQDEIQKCLNNSQSKSSKAYSYFKAFQEKPQPKISREEVEKITGANSKSNDLRSAINKYAHMRDNYLQIDAEKDGSNVTAWTLQSTKVSVYNNMDQRTADRHEVVKSIAANLDPREEIILNCLMGQFLGLPLNQLAFHAHIDETELETSIQKINKIFQESQINARLHIRNGIVIFGPADEWHTIKIIDNADTRKNLFPKKKEAPISISTTSLPPGPASNGDMEIFTAEELAAEIKTLTEQLIQAKAEIIKLRELLDFECQVAEDRIIQGENRLTKAGADLIEKENAISELRSSLNITNRRNASLEKQITELGGQIRTLEKGTSAKSIQLQKLGKGKMQPEVLRASTLEIIEEKKSIFDNDRLGLEIVKLLAENHDDGDIGMTNKQLLDRLTAKDFKNVVLRTILGRIEIVNLILPSINFKITGTPTTAGNLFRLKRLKAETSEHNAIPPITLASPNPAPTPAPTIDKKTLKINQQIIDLRALVASTTTSKDAEIKNLKKEIEKLSIRPSTLEVSATLRTKNAEIERLKATIEELKNNSEDEYDRKQRSLLSNLK